MAPRPGMVRRGPRVQVTISVARAIAEELAKQGQTIPAAVTGEALIDTGASSTCIDDAAARSMGLPVIDTTKLASVSHAGVEANRYPVRIEFLGGGVTMESPRAVGANLAVQGLLALIGRDILQHCVLIYNGVAGSLTLAAG